MFLSAIVMMKNRRASELGYIFHCVVSVFFLSSSVIFVVLVISDLGINKNAFSHMNSLFDNADLSDVW